MTLQTPDVGEVVFRDDVTYRVGRPCEKNEGHWYCITHAQAFENNISMWKHCDELGTVHRLAWWCMFDGPEVPQGEPE